MCANVGTWEGKRLLERLGRAKGKIGVMSSARRTCFFEFNIDIQLFSIITHRPDSSRTTEICRDHGSVRNGLRTKDAEMKVKFMRNFIPQEGTKQVKKSRQFCCFTAPQVPGIEALVLIPAPVCTTMWLLVRMSSASLFALSSRTASASSACSVTTFFFLLDLRSIFKDWKWHKADAKRRDWVSVERGGGQTGGPKQGSLFRDQNCDA